ncbi:hypothetical protein [Sinomonas sp. P47F7]|uniref:hypothetical protein n=1 Tax=Sinomonas sp. P47F7 TaxID=3410987 RepID=UPI003BF4D22C
MTTRTSLLGALAAGCLAAASLGAAAATADDGHTVTSTVTEHGTFGVPNATDFCTGEPISPTITGNEVFHVTFFPSGDEFWGTNTTEGTGSYVQPSTGLVFSGRVTVWGNFNQNSKNSNSTFTATFSLTAVDSAGATHTETGHITEHVVFSAADPTTPAVFFTDFNATCS